MNLTNIRKIYVLGDLHLGIRNNSIEWSEIQSNFLLDFFLKKVDADGFDPDRDILVQVGDWNHVRESTNVRIHNLSLEIAKKFSQKFKRGVYVILGNHDVYYKDRTDTHSLKGYDLMFDNFHVFEKSSVLKINDLNFLMLPWEEDVTKLKQSVSLVKADYLFCHSDFKGFDLNKATKLEHGLDYEDVRSFKKIYSGHIHIRQAKKNITYVGTPYEMDRGDSGNVKGFYVLDVSTGAVEEKFIENTISPIHVKVEMMDLLNLTLDQISALFKNNFVDVKIESTFSSRFPISQFTEMIKEFGQRRLEFFSYSREQSKNKSEVEINSNYEYNIFSILEEKMKESNHPPEFSEKIFDNFKKIYDSLKNNKSYEQ